MHHEAFCGQVEVLWLLNFGEIDLDDGESIVEPMSSIWTGIYTGNQFWIPDLPCFIADRPRTVRKRSKHVSDASISTSRVQPGTPNLTRLIEFVPLTNWPFPLLPRASPDLQHKSSVVNRRNRDWLTILQRKWVTGHISSCFLSLFDLKNFKHRWRIKVRVAGWGPRGEMRPWFMPSTKIGRASWTFHTTNSYRLIFVIVSLLISVS